MRPWTSLFSAGRHLPLVLVLGALVALPLALVCLGQINQLLLERQGQAEEQLLHDTALRIERLSASVNGSPEGLLQAIGEQLPPNARGAWLLNADGRLLSCLPSAPLAAPDGQTRWTRLELGGVPLQLGLRFAGGRGLHPLVATTGLTVTILLALVLVALLFWSRQRGALEAASERLQQTLDHAGDALFFVDPDTGVIAHANPQASALIGFPNEDAPLVRPEDMFPRRSLRRFYRLVERIRKDGYAEDPGLLFHRPDGSRFFGSIHARLGYFGKRPMVHAVLRDVTQSRQTERQLRQKNHELRLLNHLAQLLTASHDMDGVARAALDIVCPAFRMPAGAIYLSRNKGHQLELASQCNLTPEVVLAIRELPGEGSVIGQALITGQPYGTDALDRHPLLAAPEVVQAGWLSLQAIPLTNKGETLGVLALFSDKRHGFSTDDQTLLQAVAHQIGTAVAWADTYNALRWQSRLTQASNRELERSRQQLHSHLSRLEESNRALERLHRMKNNFLAVASHELRTPLTYILPSAEFLLQQLEGAADAEAHYLLESILRGGQRLDRIVGDLIEMARIEARDIYLAQERIVLHNLFDALASEFAATLDSRHQQLILPELPVDLALRGDHYHLHKALARLLENAIKFTPDGGRISFAVRPCPRSEVLQQRERLQPFSAAFFANPSRADLLQITLADTGIGINPDDCLQVFDKFTSAGDIREHFTSSSRFGGKGVGLGLALVKGMIEIQGGMVWVESAGQNSGDGTRFHVLLPLQDDSPPA